MESKANIRFDKFTLVELYFKLNKKFVPPKDGIPVDIAFRTRNSFSPDKKNLTVELSVVLFKQKKDSPVRMKVVVEGIFSGEDYKQLKKFSKINAPAHLFPFVREIIGNSTIRANLPPLLLPPINLAAILTAEKKR